MILYNAEMTRKVRDILVHLDVDAATFFRMAHIRVFNGRDPQIHDDVAQWTLNGVVPKYVQRFINEVL
jgi:hypothetical protein